MMQLPVPGSGVACSFGATDDLKVVRLQAIANLEKIFEIIAITEMNLN
jgi:hypothetical protein